MANDKVLEEVYQSETPVYHRAGQSDSDSGIELACALCYRPFPSPSLSVVSRERFNFEAAVVSCQDCLAQMKLEMKQKSYNADLVLGLIWGIMGCVTVSVPIGLTIWFNYSWPEREIWLWLGCYLSFVPAFVIGRAVYYGVGRRHHIGQQIIAVILNLVSVLLLSYTAQMAAINFQLNLMFKNGHPVRFIEPENFLTNLFLTPIISGGLSNLALAGTLSGLVAGGIVAFFASAGPQIYVRPFNG